MANAIRYNILTYPGVLQNRNDRFSQAVKDQLRSETQSRFEMTEAFTNPIRAIAVLIDGQP
jgi:hypothetical protein